MRPRRLVIAGFVLAIGIALIANRPALAGGPDDLRNWKVADDREIGDTRGGLDYGNGLEFALGITKLVYIDGILQATNTLNIVKDGAGLPHLAPGQPLPKMLTLVQNGPGNTFDPANLPNGGFFTIIQNSENHKIIHNIDQIKLDFTGLNLHRQRLFDGMLNQQTIQSLR